MASPDRAEGLPSANPATQDTTPPEPMAGPSTKRTIKSFFGGSSGESTATTPSNEPSQPKRRRKKVDEGPAQGKLGLGPRLIDGESNSSGWRVERPSEPQKEANNARTRGNGNGTGKGKGKERVDEDAELKEMVLKARQAEKEAKKVVKGRKGRISTNGQHGRSGSEVMS
jgi:hypothetical protein